MFNFAELRRNKASEGVFPPKECFTFLKIKFANLNKLSDLSLASLFSVVSPTLFDCVFYQ